MPWKPPVWVVMAGEMPGESGPLSVGSVMKMPLPVSGAADRLAAARKSRSRDLGLMPGVRD